MTGADFSDVDIDLLADYVGGALDGSPEHERVGALVAGDPAWGEAYALLSDGMGEVGDVLGGWGAVPEPMPVDVAERLDAALAEMGGVAAASGPGAGSVRTNVVDLGSRRRKRARWGASLAAAAAAVAVAGVGVAYLGSGRQSSNDSATSSTAGLAEASGLASLPQDGVTSSDTNYSELSFGTTASGGKAPASVPAPLASHLDASPTDGVMSATKDQGQALAGGLARLRPVAALQDCLDAIAGAHQAGPITVQTADYARFDGSPALVVRFSAADGIWTWVSGPQCGRPGVGADTTFSVRVG